MSLLAPDHMHEYLHKRILAHMHAACTHLRAHTHTHVHTLATHIPHTNTRTRAYTVMHACVQVRQWLALGVDPNIADFDDLDEGETPLMRAAAYGRSEVRSACTSSRTRICMRTRTIMSAQADSALLMLPHSSRTVLPPNKPERAHTHRL